jgi:hypothetical protein
MKASYRKNKNGYYPVIIFNDRSRMTHRVNCPTRKTALILAEKITKEIRENENSIE